MGFLWLIAYLQFPDERLAKTEPACAILSIAQLDMVAGSAYPKCKGVLSVPGNIYLGLPDGSRQLGQAPTYP